jgi:photosystem II stability/assembly factor-like uncharacterized protein
MRRLFASLSVLSLCCASVSVSAAAVDPSRWQELRWRLLGPFRAGRVLAVGGVPNEPEHFYFGSVNGGVWETTDAGRTWTPIFDGQPVGSIGAIAIAPSNPRVLYAGSGEADMRSDIAQGNGMYKSSDGGRSWSFIGLRDSQQIGDILVHPDDPDLVYVAALGHPYGPNEERGVFRSRDGGKTWKKILGNDSDTGAIDLAFEPGNPSVIYAAMWQTRRTPWSVYPPSNGAGSGLFKSTDGGESWTRLSNGLPQKPGRIGIALTPAQPRRVYAVVDADPDGGVYRSDDAGESWTRVGSDARVWSRGWYFGGITVEPDNADVVYSCNVNLYRSEDGGKTWLPIKGAPGGDDYHTLWIDPRNPRRRILGTDQGAVVSLNGGRTWSSWFNQPTGQFYHVITDTQFPYWVYGAQQDSGAAAIPSHTNTIDGIAMPQFTEITAGGESDNIAPDPRDPQIIYGGRVSKLDRRTGQTRAIDPVLAHPGNYRTTWTLPLVFSPRNPRVLYFAHQRLFRTENGGEQWSVISPDLTRENPGAPPNLDPVTAANVPHDNPRLGVIYAIAPSRTADRDLWAGTDDGLIWRTRDEGAHWTNVTPAALTPWSKVGVIEASHFDRETAFAAVDRHRLDDFRPYIYRTRDGGKSWQLISTGIAADHAVNVVREDPVRRGLLYAGTERGVYVSFDDGGQWQPLQMNLPVTSVRDIDVHGNDVVIATHGRAFWALDDVTPLRQSPEVGSDPELYRPAAAVRERPAGFTGTPMPKDEPLAPNPPMGAVIDYVLPAPANEVTLEILDAAGVLVRRYSSSEQPAPVKPSALRTSPDWSVPPSSLQTTPGMHRFVWPIRYPAPAALAGSAGSYANGVWAPPGKYSVVLTVDGRKFTQPLVVTPDPRVRMTPEAYARQFALAREIEQARVTVAGLVEKAPPLPPKSEPPLDSPAFLAASLQRLANAVDGADADPSPDARAAFEAIRKKLPR